MQLKTELELYRECLILSKRCIKAIHQQNIFLKARIMDSFLNQIGIIHQNLPEEKKETFDIYIRMLLEASEKKDDVLLADYLENLMNPFLGEIIEGMIHVISTDKQSIRINNEMSVEITSSGDYTLLFRDIYFHSNVSPSIEATEFVDYWDDPKESVSLVWGLGLGYHILKMLELDFYRKIIVFEPERRLLDIAMEYGVLKQIEKAGRAVIKVDPNGKLCAEYMSKYCDSRLLIHYPTLEVMKDGMLKDSLKRYYSSFLASMDQKRSYEMSFRENTKTVFKGIPDLKFSLSAKKAIIVSAGPSLDKNYLELKNKKEDTIIIASVQTMRKLYNAGIIPDCVVISDIAPELRKKHEGIESADCPLVFSSTASVPFIAEHKGPRFIFCQRGFWPAEHLANKRGWPIMDSYGGSVALVSLSLAIEKGFKEIVFIGQDLCYKGSNMHAKDTSAPFVSEKIERKMGKDIFGEEVSIPTNLSMYKNSIEKVIKEHRSIRFINATEGGLHIEGTTDMKLKDILSVAD